MDMKMNLGSAMPKDEPPQVPLVRSGVPNVSPIKADFQPGRDKEQYPTSPINK